MKCLKWLRIFGLLDRNRKVGAAHRVTVVINATVQ